MGEVPAVALPRRAAKVRADEHQPAEVERRLAKSPVRPPADEIARALDGIMLCEARATGLSELPDID